MDHHRQGQFSSYGGGHSGGCCPLVIDTLTFLSLIGFIALATYFFNIQIENSMLARDFPLLPNWMRINWIIQGRKHVFAIRRVGRHEPRCHYRHGQPEPYAVENGEQLVRGTFTPLALHNAAAKDSIIDCFRRNDMGRLLQSARKWLSQEAPRKSAYPDERSKGGEVMQKTQNALTYKCKST